MSADVCLHLGILPFIDQLFAFGPFGGGEILIRGHVTPETKLRTTPPMSVWLAGLLADMAPRRRQIVKLKPEYYDKYREVHAAVWPEVLRQIKACNIVDCGFPTSMSSPAPRPALGSCSWPREPEPSGAGSNPANPLLAVGPQPAIAF